MRYFNKNGSVYAFPDDQNHLITSDHIELTSDEVEAHLRPKPVESTVLASLKNRQFKLALLDAELIDDVEQAIEQIEDAVTKRKIQIEYQHASEFERQNESVLYMIDLLKLNQEEVDSLWIKALTF